ncbi:glycerophosphodiester phosphodiesterase [Roseicyclus sp. F158]|uniref:Glycerophosphodiester phosphodiesterase n=1 Tax=Tropicimonas omnivorans TaxID=3075590 RepID=A0ABU3DLT5_9RHOB|nr:glycerophosphodiester phosphodiesterase [Roseicyclus sp. F158]MDT0684479.1 glycerophosphodiester phosphodiesterase [Roseicyclus sp. F158]
MMKIVAHRGHSAGNPENTVRAWQGAVAARSDLVEIDVRISADGRAVCCHDPDLLRLAGDPRCIADLTPDDLTALRTEHPGIVPDLAEAFAEVPGDTGLLLDVKDESPRSLDRLAAILEDADLPGCVLGLHSVAALHRMAGLAPILALSPRGAEPGAFLAAGADILRLWEVDVVASHGSPGVPVWVTAGGAGTGRPVGDIDATDLRRLAGRGVAGVLVNDPAAARASLTPLPSDLT